VCSVCLGVLQISVCVEGVYRRVNVRACVRAWEESVNMCVVWDVYDSVCGNGRCVGEVCECVYACVGTGGAQGGSMNV
jgi:hypothetical protein